LAVIALVAIGQAENLLAEIGLQRRGQGDGVCDKIINEGAAQRSRKTQPVHLYGGGAIGQNIEPAATGVALEVNQDINAIVTDFLGYGLGLQLADIMPVGAGGDDPLADWRVGLNAVAIDRWGEAAVVKQLENFCDQISGGVFV